MSSSGISQCGTADNKAHEILFLHFYYFPLLHCMLLLDLEVSLPLLGMATLAIQLL